MSLLRPGTVRMWEALCAVAAIDQQLRKQLLPFRQAADLLETMPGIGRSAAEVLLAQIGPTWSASPRPDTRSQRDKARVANQILRWVQALGFEVQLVLQALKVIELRGDWVWLGK